MHPVLFELGGLPITSYGVALSLAFAAGITLARARARRAGIPDELVVELSIGIFVSALVGARLLFAWESPEQIESPVDLVRPLLKTGDARALGGLSMSGGVALAVVFAFTWLRYRGQPTWPVVDALAPSVLLGEAITRLGCFLNGCCHGVSCDWPWGLAFPPGSPAHAALGDTLLHPTQLYTAAGAGLLCAALLAFARTRFARTHPGVVFAGLLVALASLRLTVDLWRHYPDRAGDAQPHETIVWALLATGLAILAARAAPSRAIGPD